MTEIIPIVDAYGTSWVLNINPDQANYTTGSQFVTSGSGSVNVTQYYTPISLEWDHPEFGRLQYTERDSHPWICDNTNTLFLRTRGTLPDGILPQQVCIIPRFTNDPETINCYKNPADNGPCCDPCTSYVGANGSMEMKCNGIISTIEFPQGLERQVTPTLAEFDKAVAAGAYSTFDDNEFFQVRESIRLALGPRYMARGVFTFGTTHIESSVWAYCTLEGWVFQYWQGSLHCETKLHPNTCCPLTFSHSAIQWCKPCPPLPATPACCDPKPATLLLTGTWGTGNACKPTSIGSQTDVYVELSDNGSYWLGAEFKGGTNTYFKLKCDFNMATDESELGVWSLQVTRSSNDFNECLKGVHNSRTANGVDCPGIFLPFGNLICDEDYVDGECVFLSSVLITG